MRKRLMYIITAMVMVFSVTVSSVSAAMTMDDIVFELNTLGVMQGDENGDFQLEKPVTRAEFAAIAVRMMNLEQSANAYNGTSNFSDVPSDHWACGYIMLLNNMGIINGTGEGRFSPNDYLSYENICKMLVSCLGYSVRAESYGGYPGGYTREANNLGLTKGVNAVYPFTREATAKMVYNALYVDIMTEVYGANGLEYEVSNSTFRDKFGDIADGNIEKYEGIVTATVDAYLNNPTADMDENQIEIDNRLFRINDVNASRYIGQKVVYYVNSEASNRIISIRLSEDNKTTEIKADNLKSVTSSRIEYYENKGSSSKGIRLSDGVVLLKNNRPAGSWTAEDLMGLTGGDLTFINNNADEDDYVDVILYKNYVSSVVEDVNVKQKMIYFTDASTVDGRKYIDIDEDRNDDERVILYKEDGTVATAEDVQKDDLISICASEDGTFVEGVISRKYEEGMISSVSDDTLTINGNTYDKESSDTAKGLALDRDVKVYINFKGEAAYVKQVTTSSDYGYVASIYPEEDGSNYGARLIVPDKLQERKEEEENEDGGAATSVSLIVAKNKELKNIVFADKVTVTQTTASSSTTREYNSDSAASVLEGKTIRYRTNQNGEINNAVILTPARGGDRKIYNSYERTFGKGNGSDETGGGGFGVDFETNTICVPDSDSPAKDDYLAKVEMSNGKTYNVVCYDINDSRYTADLIVVTAPMKGGTVGELTASSDVGFVTNVVSSYDEDAGEDTVIITMLADGMEKEYKVSESFRHIEDYVVPKKGSLVTYLLDDDGVIENLNIIKSYDILPSFGTSGNSDATVFVGYALSANYNYVSSRLNRWVTRFNVSPDLEEESGTYYEIYKNNTPPIFIFNSADKSAEYGDIRSIAVGSDVISIFTTENKVRAVVVIR